MTEGASLPPGLPPVAEGSLCLRCTFCRLLPGRQSTFLICTALAIKYPRQPVLDCAAFHPKADGHAGS